MIEYREAKADEEWSQTDKIKPKKFLTGDVGSLVTGLKYEFRVIAVNREEIQNKFEIFFGRFSGLFLDFF